MDIYDDGYLTEEEKEALDIQTLIYLAAANYSGRPDEKIIPKHVYRYCLDEENKICRLKYTAFHDPLPNADVLWDDYIHSRVEGRHPNYCHTKPYYLSAWLDDNGIEYPICFGKIKTDIPMDLVGLTDRTQFRLFDTKSAYFLRWVPDSEYLDMITP